MKTYIDFQSIVNNLSTSQDFEIIIYNFTDTNIELLHNGTTKCNTIKIQVSSYHLTWFISDNGGSSFYTMGNETYYNVLYYNSNTGLRVIDDGILSFTGGKVTTGDNIEYLINNDYIRVSPSNGLILYNLNSSKNTLNKSLVFKGLISGNFLDEFNIMALQLRIEQEDYMNNQFNYLYITTLKRYYYVDSVNFYGDNFIILNLSEDVLYSHKDLIKNQTAYIERQQYSGSNDIVDPLMVTDYKKLVTRVDITPIFSLFTTTQASEDARASIVVTTVSTDLTTP